MSTSTLKRSASGERRSLRESKHRRKAQHDSYDTTVLFKHLPTLPTRCFFKIAVDNLYIGDIVIELFGDEVPKTCENFRALCTGEAGVSRFSNRPLHYEGTIFHRVISGFVIQGGDFTAHNGTGGESIWGVKFPDESCKRRHDVPYLMSMANCGPNTNGSQFFITCAPCPHLNDHHVVFGRVIEGEDIVRQVEQQATDSSDRPIRECRIAESGELVPQIPSNSTTLTTITKDSRRADSSSSSSTSSSSSSSPARALKKSTKERKRLEHKLRKKMRKEKRRMLEKLKKKLKKAKKRAKKHRSPSASSSSTSSSASRKVRRKKAKRTREEKSTARVDEDEGNFENVTRSMQSVPSQPVAAKYYCTIDPAEIPPVPEPKFLRRYKSPSPLAATTADAVPLEHVAGDAIARGEVADDYGGRQASGSGRHHDTFHRSRQVRPKHERGADRRHHKGRGDFLYGRGTPERWHQAERHLKKLSPLRADKRSVGLHDGGSSRPRRSESVDIEVRNSRDRDNERDDGNKYKREQRSRSPSGQRSRRHRSRSIGQLSSSSSDVAYDKKRYTVQSVIMPIDS